ncbi:hypothetical protein TNCV_2609031 [Trichonephila clavipes]|nr:hypothetical protein TNCV_2609031 [Trichonephila clavipes]
MPYAHRSELLLMKLLKENTSGLFVYIDGSMIERDTGDGAGVCVVTILHSIWQLERDATNFDGEVEAIFIALIQLSTRKSYFPQVVILSDSKKKTLCRLTVKFALPNEYMNVKRFSTLRLK